MPTNKKGKIFEKNFAEAAKRQDVFCLRLNDTSQAYQQETKNQTHFTPHNCCDYLVHFKGTLFALELKSTKYKSISIQRDEKNPTSMIKKHQLNSLIKLSQYDEVKAGFILNFREEDEDENIIDDNTYYLDIKQMSNFLYKSDKNSINKLDIIDYGGIRIDCKKVRKYFTYDVKGLLKQLVEKDWLEEEK